MKRRIDDKEVLKLLDKMFMGEQMSVEERTKLHVMVSNQYRKTRLRRFFDNYYSLILFELMMVLSAIAMLVTGYDGNKILFYVSVACVLLLCLVVMDQSLKKVRLWMEKLIVFDNCIEEVK